MSTSTIRRGAPRARKDARKGGKTAFPARRKIDPCRDLRPANDNPRSETNVVDRTAVWLVPVVAFALFALVVISAN